MFVIGAGMASVTGSLLVHYLRATDPERVRLQFRHQPDHRHDHRRPDLGLGRCVRRGLNHWFARGIARAVTTTLGIGGDGRADGGGADRVSSAVSPGSWGRSTIGWAGGARRRACDDFPAGPEQAAADRFRPYSSALPMLEVDGVCRVLRQPAGGERRLVHGAAGIDHRADRAEWCGQDDDVQPGRWLSATGWRQHSSCKVSRASKRWSRVTSRCSGLGARSRTCSFSIT